MIHDLRFTDHAVAYGIAAICESQSEATLLDIALEQFRAKWVRLAAWKLRENKGVGLRPDFIWLDKALTIKRLLEENRC